MSYLIINLLAVVLFSITTLINIQILVNGKLDLKFGKKDFSINKVDSKIKFNILVLPFLIGNLLLLTNSVYNLVIDILYLFR